MKCSHCACVCVCVIGIRFTKEEACLCCGDRIQNHSSATRRSTWSRDWELDDFHAFYPWGHMCVCVCHWGMIYKCIYHVLKHRWLGYLLSRQFLSKVSSNFSFCTVCGCGNLRSRLPRYSSILHAQWRHRVMVLRCEHWHCLEVQSSYTHTHTHTKHDLSRDYRQTIVSLTNAAHKSLLHFSFHILFVLEMKFNLAFSSMKPLSHLNHHHHHHRHRHRIKPFQFDVDYHFQAPSPKTKAIKWLPLAMHLHTFPQVFEWSHQFVPERILCKGLKGFKNHENHPQISKSPSLMVPTHFPEILSFFTKTSMNSSTPIWEMSAKHFLVLRRHDKTPLNLYQS